MASQNPYAPPRSPARSAPWAPSPWHVASWCMLEWLAIGLFCAQLGWREWRHFELPKAWHLGDWGIITYELVSLPPEFIACVCRDFGWDGLLYRDSNIVRSDFVFYFWLGNCVAAASLCIICWGASRADLH
jgi:hypothetical protein